MTIPLIDKYDTFEIVETKIAAILTQETIDQQALAVVAGEDPNLWAFNVYVDKYNPFETFRDNPDATPLVNVRFDNANLSDSTGGEIGCQKSSANYDIDIYAGASSADDPTGGYTPGDVESTRNLHRIIRLVRNILMHPDNTYLGLSQSVDGRSKRIVWKRWIGEIQIFQPVLNDSPVENIIAARLSFQVQFNESTVIEDYEPLEIIGITGKRAEDGRIIFESIYETT